MAQYELNILDYWVIVKKHKYIVLLTTVLVSFLTFWLTVLLAPSPEYEAYSRIKYDRTDTFEGLLLQAVAYPLGDELATQSEVIRSFPVIEGAAIRIGVLPEELTADQRNTASYLSKLYKLQQQIMTEREGDTNIIRITAIAENPDKAALIANAVAQSYKEHNIRTRNRMVIESRQFVQEELENLHHDLRAAEEALRTYQEEHGPVLLEAETNAALQAFTTLEAEYDRVRLEHEEVLQQIKQLMASEVLSEKTLERIYTSDHTSIIYKLNMDLLDLIKKRQGLLIDYTQRHPQIQELDSKIVQIRREMIRELQAKAALLRDQALSLQTQIRNHKTTYQRYPEAATQLARLKREVAVNSKLYDELRSKYQDIQVKTSQLIEEVSILEPAVPPDKAANAPDLGMNSLVGGFMGFFLGLVLAFVRESFDTSIGTIEGVEEYLGLPVLGVIPWFDEKELVESAQRFLPSETNQTTIQLMSKLVCITDPASPTTESFRAFRTNLQFAMADKDAKALVFTSAGLGEGKSMTLINTGLALAQDGKRVLLVEADLRRPVLHARLGLTREPGLTEILMGQIKWREAVRSSTDFMLGPLGIDRVMNIPGIDHLDVLPAGKFPSNPTEFLNSSLLVEILKEMRAEYDYILCDSPPILPMADAVTIGSKVDGAILVYQVGRIGRNALKRARFLLEHARVSVIGAVLTNVGAEISPDYAYSGYEYGYGKHSDKKS